MRLIASGGPVVLAWACLLPATAEEPERLSITHGPVLVSPRADGVTVLWHTNRRCVSHVEYGTGETLDRKAVSAHHGLIDANDTVHAVSLAGLAPGARVRYRVVSREIVKQAAYKVDFGGTVTSEAASFRVLDPAKGAFSFEWTEFPWGSAYYAEHGVMMPADGLETLKPFDAIYFGAVGWENVPDHVSLWGLRLNITQNFDQWANIRPVKFLSFVLFRVVDALLIDTVAVRGTAWVTTRLGSALRYLQTGDTQAYAAVMALALLGGVLYAILKVF